MYKTVQQFLNDYDTDHENSITSAQKMRWLKHIELTIMSEIMHQHMDYDKRGIENTTILYSGDNIGRYIDEENNILDISTLPEMYIDDNGTLVMTGYDPLKGEREADDFGPNTQLQIQEPFDIVYEYYLDLRIAHITGNIQAYNASSRLFNTALQDFHKYWNRSHRGNKVRSYLIRHEAF